MSRGAAVWGVLGLVVMLLEALARLTRLAWEGVVVQFAPLPFAVAVVWCVLNAYAEGYRGFQRRFVPQALDRAFSIDGRSKLEVVLAPLKVLGVWRTDPKVMRRAWVMVVGITLLVMAVKQLPQPWRGVVDAGVVVGLGWGTVAMLVGLVVRLRRAAQ
ncbi:MAG: hypothetical protein JNK82_31890 [Myxococcaceae bacterium]|nr:hypothetical protein [Myxococcaceae bacterium]